MHTTSKKLALLKAMKIRDILNPNFQGLADDNCFYVGILCQVLFSKLYILTSAHLQMLLLATA